MANLAELKRVVADLQKATGLRMEIKANTPEEIEASYLQVRQLLGSYHEKYNKQYFLQNLMLGQMQISKLEDHAKKLHISPDEPRTLFLMETKSPIDDSIMELLKNLFPAASKNYLVQMDQHSVVLLQPFKEKADQVYQKSLSVAHTIVDTIHAEAMLPIRVSFGRMSRHLCDLQVVYAETKLAMQIGNIFYTEQLVIPYDKLGVGGLIYQLPLEICQRFLSEVFQNDYAKTLDEDMLNTISKFFQNNLNIAETSRQLHMHRNTLIYRIEQLQKQTGLDIRIFEDALTLRISMMVMNYVNTSTDIHKGDQ